MCMNLFMSAEYDRSFLVKSVDATMFQQIMIKVMAPFYVPYLTIKSLLLKPDVNFITKNKEKRMTGIINCASSKELNLIEVKALSKKLGVTINDIVTTAVSTTLKKIFKEKGEDIKSINIAIPANIRFEFYDKREKVKLEN